MLTQAVTYWAPAGSGPEGTVFAAPVALLARWEDIQEEFLDIDGAEKMSNAVVFFDQEVQTGGYLYKGTSVLTDPNDVDSAWRIRQRVSIPDLRNIRPEYRAIL